MANRTHGNGEFQARVHQATGIVAAQLGCDVVDAMEAMLRYSAETDRGLDDIADDVVTGVIRFDP